MPAWQEELFGPVFVLVQADDEAHAIQLANDTPYGLGATIFTGDKDKGYDMACRELAAGSCFVNAMVRSDPRLPFGGIRHSGYGRELSVEGIRTFTNIKTVWLEA
jgi:succinate-semialdehyde dehydrogenase/glutarate-semialdehyde dehydrogenase